MTTSFSDRSSLFYFNKSIPGGDALTLGELYEKQKISGHILYIAQDNIELERLKEHLSFFTDLDILTFPEWDCMPYERSSPAKDILAERAYVLSRLASCFKEGEKAEQSPLIKKQIIKKQNTSIKELEFCQNFGKQGAKKAYIVLTTIKAITQKLPPKEVFENKYFELEINKEGNRESFIQFLSQSGYKRVSTVREVAEYAVRGEIIDVYPGYTDLPLRLDFFGDDLESIRLFDPLTQVRCKEETEIQSFTFYPAEEVLLTDSRVECFLTQYEKHFGNGSNKDPLYLNIKEGVYTPGQEHYLPLFYEKTSSLYDYCDVKTLVCSAYAENAFSDYQNQIDHIYQARKETPYHSDEERYLALPPSFLYLQKIDDILPTKTHHVVFDFFSQERQEAQDMSYKKHSILQERPSQKERLDYIISRIKESKKAILLSFKNQSALDKFETASKEQHLPRTFLEVSSYSEMKNLPKTILPYTFLELEDGFEGENLKIITQKDIWGHSKKKTKKSRFSKSESEFFVAEASSMSEGDLVVHIEYGVARYMGLTTVTVDDIGHDCLLLYYTGDDRLFVPVENSDLISKFGTSSREHPLDKLGGASWKVKKAKALEKIKETTDQIIDVAAQREIKKGIAFNVQSGLYDEFVGRFDFVETEDQERAILDVMNDLSAGKIMDRLICGDVGFGKTEVAMRAAFLVASEGKQVIIIVPTTVLAVQHFHNFQKRFQGFNVNIELLSRLVTGKKAKEIKESVANGGVDIIIGTHALLSSSVKFYNPGLLIVDEEQRFGVLQKEKIKELKHDIHVLTLTATPIPRTLQMSLSGIRDLSLITTPPINRLSVATFVLSYDSFMVREALIREYQRGGQSFFVCPKIADIIHVQEKVAKLVPELKVGVAHGKLSAKDLDDVMTKFTEKKYDILLATNIIESGIDIPNANTMIIYRSHLFGLSQLYQLRGRVGRSKNQGYCYLTYPQEYRLNKTAMKRLDIMQTLDSLGAGFTIASHDMDIRGVGNLVGEEQSGHIKEIGVELYQKMLQEALLSAKKQKEDHQELEEIQDWSPRIHIPKTVLIPEEYVRDIDVRLSLYKRFTAATSKEELESYRDELMDRFGRIPQETENLFDVIRLKMLCKKSFVEKLDIGEKGALVSFKDNTFPNAERLIKWVYQNNKTVKIRPDHKLFMLFSDATDVQNHIKDTEKLLQNLSDLI